MSVHYREPGRVAGRRPSGTALLTGLLAGCAVLFGGASAAWAGTGFGVVPNFPTPVMVGQVGVPGTLTITNISDGMEAPLNVTLDQITLVPSCGTLAISGADCPAASVDPGVLRLSPTGLGETGTVCAGVTFTTSIIDATEGKYQFTPSTPVVLGPTGSATATCRIDFTFDVVKVPTKDADPPPAGGAGFQTSQAGFAHGVASDRVPGFGGGASVTTVAPGMVPIATAVAPTPITLGATFQDTATLTPVAGAAVPTGTVTFNVFGPDDATCARAAAFTSTNGLNAAGTAATSDNFRPTLAGTYRVVATYSGDANYVPAASACADPAEIDVVNKAPLPIVTAATIAASGTFSDTATLGPVPAGAPAPTGSVTFNVYGPADPACAGTPVFTSTNGLSAAGTSATSNSFRATAASGGPGTYRFVASYTGDANYLPAASACNAPNESVAIPAPVIAVTKAAAPPSRLEPGGDFTFTVVVSNPSAVDPIRITSLIDNIYGDLAARAGSTCGALIGVTLAPGASSQPCSFTGPFAGVAGASQTDTVTVNGVDQNGFTATAMAMATVTLTGRPVIAVSKAAAPPSLVEPGGDFTFTVQVSNPSATTPVTITQLVDNIYGNLATRAGSTCGALIGVTLAPGASSQPCSFTGPFAGVAGASQTDTVTVTGMNNGTTVTAMAMATVTLTPRPVIAVTKAADPLTRPEPGGSFTFTVGVSNPSTTTPVTITKLVDNVYGDLAALPGSTCGTLIGVTLAPGASSQPCSFAGPFTGKAGDAQTDTVTVTGIQNGFTVTATAQATVSLTPPAAGPQIGLTKSASPTSRVEPGGDFTFTATVSNPSATVPVTITKLVDNIYGDLATRPGSSCGTLIGVVLAPGATSAPCTFTGPFSGKGGASQTDVITVTGTGNGQTVTATAQATVTLTPVPAGPAAVAPVVIQAPASCVATKFKVFVNGQKMASVIYYVDGKRIATVTKRDGLGHLSVTINPASLSKGKLHHLTAVVTPVLHSGQPVRTVRRTFAVCGKPKIPRFTG